MSSTMGKLRLQAVQSTTAPSTRSVPWQTGQARRSIHWLSACRLVLTESPCMAKALLDRGFRLFARLGVATGRAVGELALDALVGSGLGELVGDPDAVIDGVVIG